MKLKNRSDWKSRILLAIGVVLALQVYRRCYREPVESISLKNLNEANKDNLNK
jgi:hypothetical protein